jgi:hypothetical protein
MIASRCRGSSYRTYTRFAGVSGAKTGGLCRVGFFRVRLMRPYRRVSAISSI